MINISIALNALLVHNADMLNAEDIKNVAQKDRERPRVVS